MSGAGFISDGCLPAVSRTYLYSRIYSQCRYVGTLPKYRHTEAKSGVAETMKVASGYDVPQLCLSANEPMKILSCSLESHHSATN